MDAENQAEPANREQLVRGLDRMVETGRVTEAEAARVRAAAGPAEVDEAVLGIRLRHAQAKLTAAVKGGQMTQEEADATLDRLRAGEHPRGLRARLSKHLPRER